jgi:hypothetical protein
MNYFEIPNKSVIAHDALDWAFSSSSEWFEYYNFKAKVLPIGLVTKDPFFEWLNKHYEFVPGVLKIDPYTCYDWHIDTRRGVGINMLLTDNSKSYCAFKMEQDKLVFKINELKYKPNTYYVFNTQVPHTVYNFETTRYLFSLDFAKPKDELSFHSLVKHIQNEWKPDGIYPTHQLS